MKLSQTEKAKLVRYLLGQLPEPEQEVLETAVFSDREKFYQLCEIEDQLIDSYVRGPLTGTDRREFERYYLTEPARRERVEFARAMAAEFGQMSTADKPWWQSFFENLRLPALAGGTVTALLLIAATAWWLTNRPSPEQLAHNNGATPAPSVTSSTTPIVSSTLSSTPKPQLRIIPSPQPIVIPATITLTAITLRGEEQKATETLTIAPSQQTAQIRVKLTDQDYTLYQARLQTSSGQIIRNWQTKPVGAKAGQVLLLPLSAHLLNTGEYLLTLEARTDAGTTQPIGKLPFKVMKP